MSLKTVVAVTMLSLGVTVAQAYAEGEGNGDPFPYRAPALVSHASANLADVGAEGYPAPAGRSTQASSLMALAPSFGSEAGVQTAGSLPPGFSRDPVAFMQAQRLQHRTAPAPSVVRTAGEQRPQG